LTYSTFISAIALSMIVMEMGIRKAAYSRPFCVSGAKSP
jgi:hypothetical protein